MNNNFKCGECFPGTSGHDPFATSLTCAINEYCTDNGTCANVLLHPLYKADCPYDTGTTDVILPKLNTCQVHMACQTGAALVCGATNTCARCAWTVRASSSVNDLSSMG